MKSVQLDYQSKKIIFKNNARPSGTYGVVYPDYNQVWNIPNYENKMVTLKLLDRNSRNEILAGKKQGSGYFAPSGQSVPATGRFLDDTFVEFTKDLQEWFHYELNGGKTNPEQAKIDFKNCFRDNAWMTNFAGSWTRADYINNNGMPPYIQLQPMVMGGAVVKIVEEIIYKKQPALLVEAINPKINYKSYSPENQRWLFFRPMNSARKEILDKKGYRVGFECWYQEPSNSWYGEKMEMGIWGFIENKNSSTGWCNLIEKSRVRIISEGEKIPNPYIMRDGRAMQNFYESF